MIRQIQAYVNEIFAAVPASDRAGELREELCSNLIDKYVDLTRQGMSDEDAYAAAIASLGNVDELLEPLKGAPVPIDPAAQKRSAILISAAVMLYILSIVPVSVAGMLTSETGLVIGVALLFILCALATGLLVFNSMTKPKYQRRDDTIVEEFKEWSQKSKKKKDSLLGAVSAALWTVTVCFYFAFSFMFSSWPYSWIIFLIAIAVQQIIRAVMIYNRQNRR